MSYPRFFINEPNALPTRTYIRLDGEHSSVVVDVETGMETKGQQSAADIDCLAGQRRMTEVTRKELYELTGKWSRHVTPECPPVMQA